MRAFVKSKLGRVIVYLLFAVRASTVVLYMKRLASIVPVNVV